MNIYNKFILPRFLNREMGSVDFNETRKIVAKDAKGIVLEIGFGSGYNVPFYDNVQKLYALEPSQELYQYAKERVAHARFPVEYLHASAEDIPLHNGVVDAVISTWTLCSVHDLSKSLREISRVLKPDGQFRFAEHGRSPDVLRATVQQLITHITKHFTGDCHLNRDIETEIRNAGFDFEQLVKNPEEGRPLMFSYRGVAVRSGENFNDNIS